MLIWAANLGRSGPLDVLDRHIGAAVIAVTMTFQDHSCNGKTTTNVERHRDVTCYTEKSASLANNNRCIRQLDLVADDVYDKQENLQ